MPDFFLAQVEMREIIGGKSPQSQTTPGFGQHKSELPLHIVSGRAKGIAQLSN